MVMILKPLLHYCPLHVEIPSRDFVIMPRKVKLKPGQAISYLVTFSIKFQTIWPDPNIYRSHLRLLYLSQIRSNTTFGYVVQA